MLLFIVVCLIFIAITFIGSCGHTLCIAAILTKFNLKEDDNAGMLLIASTCAAALGLCLGYVWGALGSLFGDQLLPGLVPNIIGICSSYMWCAYSWHVIALSLNRFVAVIFPFKYAYMFSAHRSKVLIGLIWAVCLVYAGQISWLCCSVTWYTENVMSWYVYEPNETNWLETSDIALFTVPSLIAPLIFYAAIFAKLALTKQVGVDLKLVWQYFALILVNWITNMSWTVLPYFDVDQSWYYLLAIFTAFNYSLDPFIHMAFSAKVRKATRDMLRFLFKHKQTATVSVAPITGAHHH